MSLQIYTFFYGQENFLVKNTLFLMFFLHFEPTEDGIMVTCVHFVVNLTIIGFEVFGT